jgi:antirestriction protein ArdC
MPRTDRPARDVAAEITDLIIRRIEEGVPPWTRPWNAEGAGGRPLRHCGTEYTGINSIYLWALADAHGYRSRFWMTYRQAEQLGAHVRKGERGASSIYYSSFSKTEEDPATGEEKHRSIRFMRHYTVFCADQIDGLPEYFYIHDEAPEPIDPSARQTVIDAFFGAIPAEVRYGGVKAFYSPTLDYIQMPEPGAFKSMDHFASVRAHESAHWSGHSSRLARTFGRRFGDDAYSVEELVAEMCSGFVCAELGLPNELHDSHASYVAEWLRVLRADSTAVIHAAAKAEQAFKYLRAFSQADHAEPAPAEPPLAKAA